MTDATHKAEAYRVRAKQLRAIARGLGDPEKRSILLDSAMHYDFMAEIEHPLNSPEPNGRRETGAARKPRARPPG